MLLLYKQHWRFAKIDSSACSMAKCLLYIINSFNIPRGQDASDNQVILIVVQCPMGTELVQ